MIPKTLHYCFGMAPDFGGKPWSLIHYACVKSAIERIKPKDVFFYCEFEPTGPWWELTREMVTVEKIKAPVQVFGNALLHPAHRADIVRLENLLSVGGIYLDADVFVHRNFDPLLRFSTVLGEQRVKGTVTGLCNAVILAEPRAPFLEKWYSSYDSFRSRGYDDHWDEHSVKIPYQLSKEYPTEIMTLPDRAFFWPTFMAEDLKKIFVSPEALDLSAAYATHLWETFAWNRYLEHLTPKRVRKLDSNFHYWVRPMVESLPDDYGTPTAAALAARAVRRLRSGTRRALRSLFRRILSTKNG